MSKRKPTKRTHIGDGDLSFDTRMKYDKKKIKKLNIEWDNKYNASKIDLRSSI